ncbi:related to alcohol oxidase [Cephalotrichum gorgonifer]|uniref:Related to alcohol oxidase n=1 Tax=Cephalotrichum gorgonifer TaxID=2041049 RepID=A0AAE8MWH3_9PEZI|nr:related to alcohol oxidase [Cephalotrichum gorgonifer]
MLQVVGAVLALLAPTLVQGFPGSPLKARTLKGLDDLNESYDYVIIGGGTAGLTIGDRLSESGEYNASDPRDNRGSRQYNITSVPQPGLNGRRVPLGMGFCVGGSSAINGMAVMRGTKADYSIWAELGQEDSTWDWEGMLPYYRKAIHFVPPDEGFAEDYNVTYDIEAAWGQYEDTNVYASYPGGMNPGIKTIYEAMKTVPGVEFPRDGHAGSHGVFWYPVSVDPETNQRSYSRTGHWEGLERSNYDLMTGSRVNRILIDEENSVYGVQIVAKGTNDSRTVLVSEEAILSAGTIHTPQVLQLSGIGPAEFLESLDIEVKVDLPGVGANFQDHPIGPNIAFRWGEAPPTPESTSNYRSGGPGGGQGLVAFLSLPVAAPEEYEAIAERYESLDLAEYAAEDTREEVLAGYDAQRNLYVREMRRTGLSFMNYIVGGGPGASPINLHITSRGTIRLNATDLEADPVVDYRALSNPTDVDLMVAYLEFFRRFFTTGELGQWNATEVRPGEGEDLEAFVRAGYNPQGWHPVGTAAKMRRELGGVVDDELRVYGVDGLRVADASIMPTLIGGTTQLTVYAIAEKVADMIMETW